LIGGFSLSLVEFFLSATKRMHKEFFSSEFGPGGKATLAKMSRKVVIFEIFRAFRRKVESTKNQKRAGGGSC
jgi:hypothetical protein